MELAIVTDLHPPDGPAEYRPGYFRTRLAQDPNRTAVRQHICRYLTWFIPPGSDVLELGTGWCDSPIMSMPHGVIAMDIESA